MILKLLFQGLLGLFFYSIIMPITVVAETVSGSFNINLQVVPRCNLPNDSSEFQQRRLQRLDIQCSAQGKPSSVKIIILSENANRSSVLSENKFLGYSNLLLTETTYLQNRSISTHTYWINTDKIRKLSSEKYANFNILVSY